MAAWRWLRSFGYIKFRSVLSNPINKLKTTDNDARWDGKNAHALRIRLANSPVGLTRNSAQYECKEWICSQAYSQAKPRRIIPNDNEKYMYPTATSYYYYTLDDTCNVIFHP